MNDQSLSAIIQGRIDRAARDRSNAQYHIREGRNALAEHKRYAVISNSRALLGVWIGAALTAIVTWPSIALGHGLGQQLALPILAFLTFCGIGGAAVADNLSRRKDAPAGISRSEERIADGRAALSAAEAAHASAVAERDRVSALPSATKALSAAALLPDGEARTRSIITGEIDTEANGWDEATAKYLSAAHESWTLLGGYIAGSR